MKISTKIMLAILIGIIPVVVVGVAAIIGLRTISGQLTSEVALIKRLDTTSDLNSIAQFIRYYDEVLTQSARNYAFTGDMKWRNRYTAAAPELDKLIKQAISLGDTEDKKIFSSIDTSNLALVTMEEKSLNFVDKGQKQAAIDILEGAEYAKQKVIYQQGLVQYVAKEGKSYNDVLTTSSAQLLNTAQTVEHVASGGIYWVILGALATGLIAVAQGLLTLRLISRPIGILLDATKEITNGNLNKKVDIKSKDEIGQLATGFNEMVDNIREARAAIEDEVEKRTAELEKTNKHMVGRELKMVELKKEIEELKKEKRKAYKK